jgi:predicted membrane-bound dolichyl-phosphate-mannose-protein mannosyltransferase
LGSAHLLIADRARAMVIEFEELLLRLCDTEELLLLRLCEVELEPLKLEFEELLLRLSDTEELLLTLCDTELETDTEFEELLLTLCDTELETLLLYAIVRAGGGDAWMGVIAATLFSFDNLVLIQSRAGMLDMMLVLFLLCGAWCYLRSWPVLAGAGLALAADVKISGLYGLLAILLCEAARLGLRRRRSHAWNIADVKPVAYLVGSFLVVWIGVLWLLDLKLSSYHNPFDHLHHILQYGVNLTRRGGPANEESYPWQWLANDVQLNYFSTIVTTTAGSDVLHRYTVNFRGAMNPVIIGSASFGFFYAVWRAWHFQDRLSLWAVTWVIGTYLPYYPLVIVQGRIGYLYYFLPTLPAVAVGLAQFLRQTELPRPVVWGYLVVVLVGFVAYFPFRTIISLGG